jgi:hypothetical protein
MLRPLLNSDQTLVRQEAYKMLAHNGDSAVYATPLKSGFTMDVVRSSAAPIIYATRRGEPRLAIMGTRVSLETPVAFSAMGGRLTISSNTDKSVTIYYRPAMPPNGPRTRQEAERLAPIMVKSRPDVVELVARLAGEGFEDAPLGRKLDFNYGEILSILSSLTANRQLTALANGGTKMPASFILQELPTAQDSIYSAPVIPDQGRPQSDGEQKVGLAK